MSELRTSETKLGGGDVGCELHNVTSCEMCANENRRSPLPAGERVGADRPVVEPLTSNSLLSALDCLRDARPGQPVTLSAEQVFRIVCAMGPSFETVSAPIDYQCRKCGSSDVIPWPTNSAPSAAVEHVSEPSNEGSPAATVGAGPNETCDDLTDKQRLDFIEAWLKLSKGQGLKWDTFALETDTPVREQIDQRILAGMAERLKQGGELKASETPGEGCGCSMPYCKICNPENGDVRHD